MTAKIKCFLPVFLIVTLLTISQAFAQGYEIKVQVKDLTFDTLRLQRYDAVKGYVDVQTLENSKSLIFKNKTSLKPGIYFLAADSMGLSEILISDEKNQKFSIHIFKDSIVFVGSYENAANQDYARSIRAFEMRMQDLDKQFQEMRSSNLPSYMMQPFVDTLLAKATKIAEDKLALQNNLVEKYKGMLLASVIKTTIEMPNPSQECYQNQFLMEKFMAEHLYDTYAWEDARMVNTPVAPNRHKRFAMLLYYLDGKDGMPYLLKNLEAAKANEVSYFDFFDQLEKVLNSKSEYCVEDLYIAMLKDALAYDKTDKARKVRYERELSHLDKNLAGTIIPNFKLLMSTGDSTTMYDVESPYMLLYFQHPECPTCRQARERMKDYPFLNEAIANGKVKVLTVYFEKDKSVFDKFLKSEANPNWLHSWNYDNEIEEKELYYLARIPYMFLLDKDKRVIKKDILINEIEDYIKQLP